MASPASFAKLFRYSKFVKLGDFGNRLLVGKIVHRVKDDLYVDMGLKFNAVCRAPPKDDATQFLIGSQVVVRLHDPELSERFLGSEKDLTLLEADATLIGLYNPPKERTSRSGQAKDRPFALGASSASDSQHAAGDKEDEAGRTKRSSSRQGGEWRK